MRRNLTFIVDLDVTDSIYSDSEIKTIGKNIGAAIKRDADYMGITPDDTDSSVTSITVSDQQYNILTDLKL
jgi:hypothetical protein